MSQLFETINLAPKARNAKAWGIAPGMGALVLISAESAKFLVATIPCLISMPRLQRLLFNLARPGAMPQAFAFRALALVVGLNSNQDTIPLFPSLFDSLLSNPLVVPFHFLSHVLCQVLSRAFVTVI